MRNEDIIKGLLTKPLEDINIKLDDVTYGKEGSVNVLRIIIDKEPYIDVDDCVNATNVINPILDKEDVIKNAYILDVCSKEKGGDK